MTQLGAVACLHLNFSADVAVARIVDTGRFMAEVRVRCTDCDTPFQFVGLDRGLHPTLPRASFDLTEARMPIAPPITQRAGTA